jgi:hypothetical protein
LIFLDETSLQLRTLWPGGQKENKRRDGSDDELYHHDLKPLGFCRGNSDSKSAISLTWYPAFERPCPARPTAGCLERLDPVMMPRADHRAAFPRNEGGPTEKV